MKKMKRSDLEKNFKNEKMDRKKLNYLFGGDGNGNHRPEGQEPAGDTGICGICPW